MTRRARHVRSAKDTQRIGAGFPLERTLLPLLAVLSLAVFAIWILALSEGAFSEGVLAYQLEGTVPIFHLTAEFSMALVTLAGIAGMWTGRSWGRGLLAFGVGMFTYSAVNSLGWALHEEPATALPMFATLILAAVTLYALLVGPTARQGERP